MRVEFNYTPNGFFQLFPLFYITNENESAIVLGLFKNNIALVFGNNNKKEYHSGGGQVNNGDGKLKEFSFIWYKKMQNGTKTHYTEPFRTAVKAKSREEAVEQVTRFAMQKMTLIVTEESKFNKSEYGRVREDFEYINKAMADIESRIGKWKTNKL